MLIAGHKDIIFIENTIERVISMTGVQSFVILVTSFKVMKLSTNEMLVAHTCPAMHVCDTTYEYCSGLGAFNDHECCGHNYNSLYRLHSWTRL